MKFIFAIFVFFSLNAHATTGCQVTVDRTPCPGKESVAHVPYGNRNPITSAFPVRSSAKCQQAIQMSAANYHPGILAKIEVTGTYNGTALQPATTTTACTSETRK